MRVAALLPLCRWPNKTRLSLLDQRTVRERQAPKLRGMLLTILSSPRTMTGERLAWRRTALRCARIASSAGIYERSGLPISQWWPDGSATRPTRHPCPSVIGATSVAPAAIACSNTASGSSTVKIIRTGDLPPRASGLESESCCTQKVAPPIES